MNALILITTLSLLSACDDEPASVNMTEGGVDEMTAGAPQGASESGIQAGVIAGQSSGVERGSDAGVQGGVSADEAREWTILVYSAADNNLERPMLSDIAELASIGSSDLINLIIQVDRSAEYSDSALLNLDPFIGTKRLAVSGVRTLMELDDLGVIDSGSADTLKDFIIWGVQRYPAKRYMLIMSNHGAAMNGIAFDYDMRTHISLNELSVALRESLIRTGLERFDLIGFDACLMATVEVATFLSPFADLMLASAAVEPGHGWDYNSFALIRDQVDVSPEALGHEIIKGYKAVAEQAKTFSDVTLSLIDLRTMEDFTEALSRFAELVSTQLPHGARDELSKEILRGIIYGQDDNSNQNFANMYELKTLIEGISRARPELASVSADLLTALERSIVHHVAGENFAAVLGLSIHFPMINKPIAPLYVEGVDEGSPLGAWRSLISAYQANVRSIRPAVLRLDEPPQLSVASGTLNLSLFFEPEGAGQLYHPETLLNLGSVGYQSCDYVLRYTSDDFSIDHESGRADIRWFMKRVVVKQGDLRFEPHWRITKTPTGYQLSTVVRYVDGDLGTPVTLIIKTSPSLDQVYSIRLLNPGLNGASSTQLIPAPDSGLQLRQLCQIGAQPQGFTTLRSSAEVSVIDLTSPLFSASDPLEVEFIQWELSEHTFVLFDHQAERLFTWLGKLIDI